MRALPTAIFGLMSLLLLLCLGSVETLQGVATLLPSDLDASPTTASPAFVHAAALRALASPSGALKVLVFNDMPCGSDFFGAWFKPPLRMDCGTELEFYRWDFRRNISAMDAVLISVGQATLLAPTLDLGAPHGVSNAAPSPTLKRRGQRWFSCSKENGKSFFTTSDSELRSVYGIDYILNYKLSSDQPQTFLSHFFVGDFTRTLRPAKPPSNTIRKLAVMQAKCDGIDALGEAAEIFRKRKEFIRELAAAVPTDSMGPCLHTMEPRYPFNDFGGALGRRPAQFHYNKMENVRDYMFTLAAESVQRTDWVTEKVYQALAVGSVPVYLGAPNVEAFLPCRHCIVNARDFSSAQALGAHLRYLMNNSTAYDALLDWTRQEYRPEDFPFLEKYVRPNSFDFSACHICEKLRPGKCNCNKESCSPSQVRLITEANPGTHG